MSEARRVQRGRGATYADLERVDPLERILEVYRRQDGNWLRVGAFEGYTSVRAEPFDAEELDMGRW